MADRSVDFFLCGGLFCASAGVFELPVFCEFALTAEYRAELGLVLCALAVELRAAEALDAPPSGLGPPLWVALEGGCCVGVDGCSRTVCGTSMTSGRPAGTGNVCATAGAKPGVTGEAGFERDCCSWRCSASSFSMGVELAMPVPGFLMGNSSSSRGLGMGIGPEILPRMDWCPVLGLEVVGEDGGAPNILAFILALSREAVCLGPDRRNLRGGKGDEISSSVVVVVM